VAIFALVWSVVLLAIGAGCVALHRGKRRGSEAFGLAKMREALWLYGAAGAFSLALLFGVWGIAGSIDLVLRVKAQSFASGLTVVCGRDWIDVSNPTDREGWVRVYDVRGNGGPAVIDLDSGASTQDPARVAYPKPSEAFPLSPRTTRHVTLSLPTKSPCGPKSGSSFLAPGLLQSLFPEEPCDTWSVTLTSGTEQRARGGVTFDCPILATNPPSPVP
jgi:hypothetical protein